MEQLADRGNGNYAYIDSLLEARKVLAQQLGSTAQYDCQGRQDSSRFQSEPGRQLSLAGLRESRHGQQ